MASVTRDLSSSGGLWDNQGKFLWVHASYFYLYRVRDDFILVYVALACFKYNGNFFTHVNPSQL